MSEKITIALAGNANVGKSVIFNHLTALHQHIGNWPGKTVEKAEGTLHFKGYKVDVLDLPGIYSLSTFSLEELVSREYIAIERPDIVINVVDATALERNLFFTIQLLELETPLIIALNQIDLANKKGIVTDRKKLQTLLGIPVIPTVAIKGMGIHQLLQKAIELIEGKEKIKPSKIEYHAEIEKRIDKFVKLLEKIGMKYPSRWVAIKLLEGDEEIIKIVSEKDKSIIYNSKILSDELERIYGQKCSTVISTQRYEIANKIAQQSQKIASPKKLAFAEKLDLITTHKFWGYAIMLALVLSMFFLIFMVGNFFSGLLTDLFDNVRSVYESAAGTGTTPDLIWGGFIEGIIAGITIVLPFILPFYIILGLLEDSGYLARVAFLMDSAMHKMGLHGKAFIPFLLGYGCNVPACLGCRIMETHRERLIAAFVVTLVPCAARTVVILGLVGAFVGIEWALLLYVIDLAIIFILGRIAFKILPGEPVGLIMEMPSFKVPSLKITFKQAWWRIKDFIYIAFPLIIAGSLVLKLLEVADLLDPIGNALSPVTVTWLGLPAVTGIALILGILRKELTLIMLATLLATQNMTLASLTSEQMIVFALVTMLYIPCISTIAALAKEFGWKRALYIAFIEIGFAVLVGGIAFRILSLVMW